MRIVVCGKGGSGKSTIVTLMARVLIDRGYKVHVLDSDASNPGLYWMLGFDKAPEPLIDFYGGRSFTGGKVTCPVDDPTPLSKGKINLDEITNKYFLQKEGVTFFKVGKVERVYGGCDGPESKITRDFRIPGEHITLIDLGAGLEHFGRGVEINADGVIAVVDSTSTSLVLARITKEMVEGMKSGIEPATAHMEEPEMVKVAKSLAKSARVKHLWLILNKIRSQKTESLMKEKLRENGMEATGTIPDDPKILESSLEYGSLEESGAKKEMGAIVDKIEGEKLKEIENKKQRNQNEE